LPDIKTLFTVNLDCHIRAHGGANRTAVAFLFFVDAYGMIPLGIICFGRHDVAFRAEMNAEMTLLAKFLLYLDISFQNMSPNRFLPGIQFLSAVAILLIMFTMSSIFRLK